MTPEQKTSKKEYILLSLLAAIAMAVTTVAVVPSLKNKARDFFVKGDRSILAKVEGSLTADGPRVTVLKIKTQGELSVEVYEQKDEGLHLMSRLTLDENRDGYFSLQGNATNLALTDVDGDGVMEVVAPTYDDQMVPRLNIFKYNAEAKSFDRVNSPVEEHR
ncbi:hypothetical protein D3C87_1507820 [compost metagenome]